MEMAFNGMAATKGDPDSFNARSRARTPRAPVSRLLPALVLKMSGWSWREPHCAQSRCIKLKGGGKGPAEELDLKSPHTPDSAWDPLPPLFQYLADKCAIDPHLTFHSKETAVGEDMGMRVS